MKKLLWACLLFINISVFAQTKPVLSNFRVEESHKDRVYFDASGDMSGMTSKGFVITGKTITSVNTSANYFKVSKPFTFWDNNTIRLGEITDKNDKQSVISNFTLQYVKNNISEPKGTGKTYYVTTKGNDKDSGLSETKAWRTITFAAQKAKGGDVVYIKAGEYGDKNIVVKNNGTENNPIKFIGYTSSIGDKPSLERSVGMRFDNKEMPLIKDGTISCRKKDYIIFKNIQIYNSGRSAKLLNLIGSNYTIVENIYTEGGSSGIINFDFNSGHTRVINSYVANASLVGVRLANEYNLIENTWAVSSKVDADMDYYINIYGGKNGVGNIIKNCYVDRDLDKGHSGHGISLKAGFYKIEHSLVEKCVIYDIGLAIEARHSKIKNNVYRDIYVSKNSDEYSSHTGIQITSAQNCVFERIHVDNYSFAIKFLGSTEDPDALDAGNGNIIKNCLFTNIISNILLLEDLDGQNRVPNNNKIINCTFSNSQSMYTSEANEYGVGNVIINSIINNVTSEYGNRNNPHNFTYKYTDFFNSKTNNWSYKVKSGTGNISLNPMFEGSSKGNYRLMPDSPLIDKGSLNEKVETDFDGNPRPQGNGIDIGAYEYQDNTTSSIKANAGSDQNICFGEHVTLTATGGSTYSWNTGATTQSITVNPNETTNYTVTVSEGGATDSDSVIVMVNSIVANAGSDKTINEGETVTLTASGGESYQWSTGASTQSITVNPNETTTYTVTAKQGTCEDTDTVQVIVNQNSNTTVTANAGSDQSICLGESVTLTATGGSSYSWSTGETTKSITVNPNETTTYTVTVSEGGATDSDSAIVTVNSVVANAGSNKTIYEGETVTLTASGGESYQWNTGASTQSITVNPNETTTYTVTAKQGTCEDTDTVQVIVNQNSNTTVTANAGSDQSICLGESVTLTATGGSSYSWSTGETTKSITVNPNETTTYTVTVSEGGATDSDSAIVTVNSVVANAGSNKTIYEGETVTLTASGGESYQWNTGATTKSITVSPQETQNYILTAYKNGCEDTDVVQVIVNKKDTSPPPAKANAGEDQTICLGDNIKLTASGGKTYLWSTGETTKSITVNPTRTTSYTVTASRGGVTNSDTVNVTVENCSALNEEVSQKEMTVYPNPTMGTLNIKADNNFDFLNLNIYSMNGSIVYSDVVQTSNNVAYKSVNLSNLSKGVYIVRMYNTDYHKTKRVLLY